MKNQNKINVQKLTAGVRKAVARKLKQGNLFIYKLLINYVL